MDNLNGTLLQQWIGRRQTCRDVIGLGPAAALAATLDRQLAPEPGTALPPLWHWMYFWAIAKQSETGSDGHPQRGGFLPPIPLPRRMWAGGRLTFHAPLAIGGDVTRTSEIVDVTTKSGRSGELAFVKLRHEIAAGNTLAITEEQDIVYRGFQQPGSAAPAPTPAPASAAWSRTVVADPVFLFRYSALTFNGHRIHYDRSYATTVEGYPGLVVHGPLIATLLVDLFLQCLPNAGLSEFSFRALAPLFDSEPFEICGQPAADGRTVQLWARNARGALCMQAEARLAELPH